MGGDNGGFLKAAATLLLVLAGIGALFASAPQPSATVNVGDQKETYSCAGYEKWRDHTFYDQLELMCGFNPGLALIGVTFIVGGVFVQTKAFDRKMNEIAESVQNDD